MSIKVVVGIFLSHWDRVLVFVLAGIIVMFIALITISFQAFIATRANPVNGLMSE